MSFVSYNAIVACEFGPRQTEPISLSFALQICVGVASLLHCKPLGLMS